MEFSLKNYLKIVLIFVLITTLEAARDFDFFITSANCTIRNANYVAELNCPIIELPRNHGNYLSANIMFKKDIPKLLLEFCIVTPTKLGKSDNELLKFRVDGCKLASYKANNPFVTAAVKKLRSAGNFPGYCPLKGNINYTIERFALNPDYFPPYTPDMNFAVKFNLYMGKLQLLATEVHAAIQRKK